jgi:Protein of unknown function (DUF1822)
MSQSFPLNTLLEPLPDRTIHLNHAQFQQAVEWSDRLPTEDSQWRTYLNGLMVAGFQTWLAERAPDLIVQTQQCTLLKPEIANLLDAVCHLEVAGWKIDLIRLEVGDDDTALIPRAVIDLPEFAAHLYLLVEVLDEEEEIILHGSLNWERLAAWQRSHPLVPQPNWTYTLPLDWFDPALTHLIVSLRCADLIQPTLPKVPERAPLPSHQWTELTTALSRLNQAEQPLWTGLSWEQGATLFIYPHLANWLYQEQLQPYSESQAQASLSPSNQGFNRAVINSWIWMQDQLDQASHLWGWTLQPALAAEFRTTQPSPSSEQRTYGAAIAALCDRGITLPNQDYNACLDFNLGTDQLRLRAIPIPAIPSPENPAPILEWRLVVILDAQPEHKLAKGITLQVSDDQDVLDQQVSDQGSDDAYLFSCVVGGWDEQFTITIQNADGTSLTLPPFAFQPDQPSEA